MNESINRIWKELGIPLKSFINKRVNNDQDAEDILQEVFLKLFTHMDGLKNVNKIHAWIYTITRNTIIDYYRLNKRDNMVCLTEDLLSVEAEEEYENSEIAGCLKLMIEHLPEKYKQALIYTEFEHLTQKELAIRLGLSISGAKSRVQRARRLLKEMLLECCSLEMDHRGNIISYHHKNKDCNYC